MHSVGNYIFSNSDLLGHGAFALVYKGIRRGFCDDPVAIKKIRKSSFSPLMSKERKEISILSGLKHENIVRMLDFEETTSDIFLVLEFCNMGDLNDFLHKYIKVSEEYIRIIFKQIGLAITFLHSHQIIHRDLKPQNILLHSNYPCLDLSIVSNFPFSIINSSHFFAKIGDFGFARVLADTTMATTLCGSPLYMAPEVLLGYNYDSKVDMWSIGTIIYQCFTGSAPFIAKTPQLLRKRYETEHKLQPKLPNQASPDLNSLLLGLLKKDYKVRLGYAEFCTHPFFQVVPYFTNFEPIMQNNFPNCNDSTQNVLSEENLLLNDFSFPRNDKSSDYNYMFAVPETRVHCTSHYSMDPPSKFSFIPSHNFKPLLEILPSRSGYVLVPARNSNILLKSENRLISSLPTTIEPCKKSFSSRSSITEVPFSSLVPLNAKIIEKNKFCRPKINFIDDLETSENLSSKYALGEIYDVNIVKDSFPSVSNVISQPNILILPPDRSINCQNILDSPALSCYIPTMFIDSFNIDVDNHSRLPINIPPLQYLECPFQPIFSSFPSSEVVNPTIDTSLIPIVSETFDPDLIVDENLLTKSRLRYSHKSNEVYLSEIQQYLPQEKSLSLLLSPQSFSDLYSDPPEEIQMAFIHSQFILDTICFLKYPSFSLSIDNLGIFSQKSCVSFTLKKLVLLVKVIKVLFKILDYIHSVESCYSEIENSEISRNYVNILKLLQFSKNELFKIKVSYLCTPSKFEVYRSFIPSAETLLCNHMIYLCQNGALKQIFDKKEHVYRRQFFMAWVLSKELSPFCYKEALPSFNLFSEYTHDIVYNRRHVL